MKREKKKIVIAPKDEIDNYEFEISDFFEKILDLDYLDCLVTDESRLSDFSSCGLPEEKAKGANTLPELYRLWDIWVIERIEKTYKLRIDKTNILLIDLDEED